MAAAIRDLLSLREISPMHFESVCFPEKMGNTADQAYGGYTLAIAVNAALQTVPSKFHLYTAMGNFLGPAFVDRTLHCSVRSLRTTKTFATRLIEVSQIRDDGQSRLCLFMTADFHIQEPHTLLTYSRRPKAEVSHVQDSPTTEENLNTLFERGTINEQDVRIHKKLFKLEERLFERRTCPESIMTQNFAGAARRGTTTTQDHLPLPDKTSADYFRVKHHLETPAEHMAALAFVMDMGISFLPLVHSGSSLTEAGVQSSLDFAIRVFIHGGEGGVDLNAWNLREMSTVTGGEGRTYTEARVWDEKGRMVCNMTQQCILRPKLKVEEKAKI
ncbi:MAG: hypothetical protein HETSPECPRED_008746 [Heterodermia speciosa]|uniref:Thioesterase/thiol ester dehydrase-isomerase n=1 Tax=Heterodermia speciosa TaxID=116794 RepID=A0A8H3G2P4_9LECA|nr:MAG: hypothetical protein HETSPECPRED_008746 [Heterodermia speciosa]